MMRHLTLLPGPLPAAALSADRKMEQHCADCSAAPPHGESTPAMPPGYGYSQATGEAAEEATACCPLTGRADSCRYCTSEAAVSIGKLGLHHTHAGRPMSSQDLAGQVRSR